MLRKQSRIVGGTSKKQRSLERVCSFRADSTGELRFVGAKVQSVDFCRFNKEIGVELKSKVSLDLQ